MASSRVPYSSVFPAFRPLAKLVPPTTPSADFSAAITSLTTRLVQCPGHNGDLPRFDRLPCTPAEFTTPTLDDHGLRNQLLVRSGSPRYPVFVHRAAGLLHASFRLRLATTPLRFANPSPSSGWVQDFHLQAVEHARHTTKRPARSRPSIPIHVFARISTSISTWRPPGHPSDSSRGRLPSRGPA
jgi:hypothetical protein